MENKNKKLAKLYMLVNAIGSYYVIAEDPTSAENKLMDLLNNNDYGFSSARVVKEIRVVAEEVGSGAPGISGKFLII